MLINSACIQVLTAVTSFPRIVTNQAGDAMHRYQDKIQSNAHFQLRQVLGSVNFRPGDDIDGFLHDWLNYQIEHHGFPDLSRLHHQRAQPLVKALCAEHGVTKKQESVWRRLEQTLDIITGEEPMPYRC